MSSAIVFISMALFIVYMQRQNRWSGFLGAATGDYTVRRVS